jgi:hypothetical protein
MKPLTETPEEHRFCRRRRQTFVRIDGSLQIHSMYFYFPDHIA